MQDQWSWVFSNFGITDIWEYDADHDGQRGKDGSIYQDVKCIQTAADLPPEPSLIVLAPIDGRFVQGENSLKDFVHPEDAIYMFGGSHSVLTLDDLGGRTPDHTIYIPTVKHEMYSFAAGYITIWDRLLKRG